MAKTLYDHCIELEEYELLAQWDKQKNEGLTPRDVSKASHRKVWWKCSNGHSWQTVVYARSVNHSGCPYCTGRQLPSAARVLAAECPELVKDWHPTKNHGLSPDDIAPGSHQRVWWQCEKGHEWPAEVKSRVNGSGCPVCSNRKIIVGENDLATTHPEIAAQWHPEKNGTLTPKMVVYGNQRKVWWRCEKGHEWSAAILSRTSSGSGCPVCSGKLVLPGVNDLASQKPHIAAQWHPSKNGTLTPKDVTAYSNRHVWWVCDKGHEYRSSIALRSRSESDCPYCKNRRVMAGFNDLATVEPKIAAQWHPDLNGTLTPQMVTVGSTKKVWWQCGEGHVWQAVIFSRTGKKKCACPVCSGRVKQSKQRRYEDIMAEAVLAQKQA